VATEALEIERKYEAEQASGSALEPPLDGLPGVAEITEPQRLRLEAVYHDTEDLRLARAGVSLRRRSGGSDDGWHLKLPTGRRGERTELRLPSGPDLPEEFVDLTLALRRGATLRPVARLDTTRTRRLLLDSDGSTLAEVVSDEVSGQTLGSSSTLTTWHELEVELAGGSRTLLDAVDARLHEFGARRSASTSKIGRLLDVAPQAQRKRKPTAGEAVLEYFRLQVDRMVAADPRARRDEPGAVHNLRVGARWARSTLQSFRGVLDRERTDAIVEELRWLGRALAGARDAEVQHAGLLRDLRKLPAELVLGPVRARVDSHFAAAHARAREEMLAVLRGSRYLTLLDRLHDLLHDPPLTPDAARRARKALPPLVARAQRRVRKRIKRARGEPARLHEARKAAKRARYAAEAVPGKRAKRSAKRLKDLQRLLGDHQDSVTASRVLRDLGTRAHQAGENGFSYGLLLGQHRSRAAHLRDRLPRLWRRADRNKIRKWMS
jgi:CHAD domain-containing protein